MKLMDTLISHYNENTKIQIFNTSEDEIISPYKITTNDPIKDYHPDLFTSDPFEYIITYYLSSKDLTTLYLAALITKEKLCQYISEKVEEKLCHLFSSERDQDDLADVDMSTSYH